MENCGVIQPELHTSAEQLQQQPILTQLCEKQLLPGIGK